MGDEECMITTNPDIGNGSPIIAGTRIKVEDVMRRIAGKQTVEEIARNLLLKKEQVEAAITYAQEHQLCLPTPEEEEAELNDLMNPKKLKGV